MFQLPGILSGNKLPIPVTDKSIRAFNHSFAVTVLLEYHDFSCKHEKMQLLNFKQSKSCTFLHGYDFQAVVSQVLLA